MSKRRNENDSYRTLISLLEQYNRLQIDLQYFISKRCIQLINECNINFPQLFKDFYVVNQNELYITSIM